jgi:uroporphyrinogen-III decarboxylase
MDLSPKENYLRAWRHEDTEFQPCGWGMDAVSVGDFSTTDRGAASTNFIDGYGVRWVTVDSAVGAFIPAPGEFILKDVTQWKKQIKIPNIKDYDWEKIAAAEKAALRYNHDEKAFCFLANAGVWERLADLMGFEEGMIAMVEEPDAVYELMSAITDHKIRLAEVAKKYFDADTFVNFDDIATNNQLFMSPEVYRKLIKPQHKRLNDAVINLGMIPVQHTCGHAEMCVEDYIETNAAGWNTVQVSNDIVSLLENYGDKFTFEGGFDSNGRPGQPDATMEEVIAEVERCFHDYGGKKGYIPNFGLVELKGRNTAEKTAAMFKRANEIRFGK